MNFTSILNNQSLSDICAYVKQDCNDTMTKISSKYSSILSALPCGLDVGDLLTDVTSTVLSDLDNVQLVTGDGDIINLRYENNALNTIDKDNVLHPLVAIENNVAVVKDTVCYAINDTKWTPEEVLSSITNTYTTNDLVYRASDLVSSGDFTVADFNARCSDIISNLSGNAKVLYSNIINCVSGNNQNGLLTIINNLYSGISNASVNNDSIDFAQSDYYVEGFCGTIFLNILASAAQVLGGLIAATGHLIGLAVMAVGTVISTVSNLIGSVVGTNATIKYSSLFRLFAQPIFQKSVSRTKYSWLDSAISTKGVCKFVCSNFVLYGWLNSTDDTVVQLECFLNCSLLNKMGTEECVDNFEISADTLNGYHYIECNGWGFATSEDGIRNSVNKDLGNYSNYGLLPDDDQVRQRVGMALLYMAVIFTIGNGTNYTDNVDYFTDEAWHKSAYPFDPNGSYNDPTGTTDTAAHNATLMIGKYITNASGVLPSWSDMVNKIIPSFYDNDGLLKCTLNYIESCKDNVTCCATLTDISGKGDFWITPPTLTHEALIWAVIAGVVVAAAAVASYFVLRTVVKKKIANVMSSKYAKVSNAYDAYSEDPDNKEKFKEYYKQLKRYNMLACITGYSSLSVTNGWESGDSTSSSILDTVAGVGQTSSSESEDSISSIRQLIAGIS